MIKNTSNDSKAGLPAIVDSKSEILILGTLPSEKSLKKGEYYANPSNQFWKIISSIFNEPTPITYDDKLLLLQNHHIALWDVLKTANRKNRLDSSIENPIPNDIMGFIANYPSLRIIGFNGKKAMTLFKKTFISTNHIPKRLQIRLLPSTSSANTHLGLDEKIMDWKKILER